MLGTALFTGYLSLRGKGMILEGILEDRLSKKSFIGFHMARDDLSRLRRSQCQSAASWPKKARSLAKQRRRLVASLLIRQKD